MEFKPLAYAALTLALVAGVGFGVASWRDHRAEVVRAAQTAQIQELKATAQARALEVQGLQGRLTQQLQELEGYRSKALPVVHRISQEMAPTPKTEAKASYTPEEVETLKADCRDALQQLQELVRQEEEALDTARTTIAAQSQESAALRAGIEALEARSQTVEQELETQTTRKKRWRLAAAGASAVALGLVIF